jgi:iron transport multicopper oxidase
MVDIVRSIIASEIGCEKSEILPTTILGNLRVDYLMSVSIVNAIQSKTGIDIPATFLRDQLTLSDVFKKLGIAPIVPISNQQKQSTSIFLQGSSTNLPPLFLLPDGSGSASSYVPLPVFDNTMIIYGLNSPFLDCPSEFTCKVEEIAGIYLTEIRKRQPFGPYILGGWSAGGILAYEAATQLLAAGEKVLGLIFIDSPCPVTLPPFPFEYIEFLDSIGIFDNIHHRSNSIPAAIKAHFKACLTNFMQYKAKPIDPSKAPKAVAIWAKEGVLESISHEHSEVPKDEGTINLKDWLLEPRKDYGPGGWEKLLPIVECVVIPGNHFTIMRQPHVRNNRISIDISKIQSLTDCTSFRLSTWRSKLNKL